MIPAGVLVACGDSGVLLERSTDDVVMVIEDPHIRESSGLAQSVRHEGVLYTHNDAGNEPLVFALGRDGDTLATFDLTGAPATDWEDVAVTSDGRVWVGDIGGNQEARATISVVTFEEPADLEDDSPSWTSYDLAYPDGAHNAEALLVNPLTFRVYVVTKGDQGESALYGAPRRLNAGTTQLTRLAATPPNITAGAFAPDGSGRAALRNYNRAFIYERLDQEPRQVELPKTRMGESLVLLDDGDLILGSEGVNSEILLVRDPSER